MIRGNFIDRLGFPYQTVRQCDSCPDSCELATKREYKKKLMYKSKRQSIQQIFFPKLAKIFSQNFQKYYIFTSLATNE